MSQSNPAQQLFKNAVLAHYANHPDLIQALVASLGSQQVHMQGSQVRGTCPIHNGTNNKNFVVWFDTGIPIWKCYSNHCGVGPLHTLVAKRLQLSDIAALNYLAKMAGLTTWNGTFEASKEAMEDLEQSKYARLQAGSATQLKPNYFPSSMLAESLHVKPDYLVSNQDPKKRFTQEVLDKFQIGFIPARRWTWPEKDSNGVTKIVGWYDDRITIPIRMQDGSLVGFFGRHLSSEKHLKYLALPHTSRPFTLYGLHFPETLAEIQRTGEVILVEGFGDVWRAHQFKCHNVVAPMGTELSPQQLSVLSRLSVRKIIFYYDNDDGGQSSARRFLPQVSERFGVFNAAGPPNFDPGDAQTHEEFHSPILQSKPFSGASR